MAVRGSEDDAPTVVRTSDDGTMFRGDSTGRELGLGPSIVEPRAYRAPKRSRNLAAVRSAGAMKI
ncbi:MAG TPA: hypothetical protein VEK07_22120 [Polyangiaceae bacterium]|nr:hypothetical protein [Polyangiaceae bacterium]